MLLHHRETTNNSDTDRLLVFVHIPKTAGTTLNSLIAHQYANYARHKIMMRGMSLIAPRHVLFQHPLISPSKIRRLKVALRDPTTLRVIHGHFDLSLGKLLPADADLITLLRSPVERAISHYYHYRKLATDPVHPLAMRSTLTEWVSACRLVEMDNGQTRRLAGAIDLPIGKVSSQTLNTAKANLANKFAVVGLTERFDEFQILLHRKFDWPYCRYAARNVGDNRPQRMEMSKDVLATVENCNRFDLELYQFASDLFDQAVRKVDMDKELSLLRLAPEYVEPPCPQVHDSISKPHRTGINALMQRLLASQAIKNCFSK